MYKSIASICLIGLLSASVVRADDKPDVVELLKKVDKATKALIDVSYEAKYYGEGKSSKRLPKIEFKASAKKGKQGMLGGMLGGSPDLVRFDVTVTPVDSDEKESFKFACDGKKIYFIDEDNKTFTQTDAGRGLRMVMRVLNISMREYVHPTPFSDEINAEEQTYEGEKEIGGVNCDVVYVVYSGGQGKARWYFGQKDHLPRRVDRFPTSMDGEELTSVLSVSNLEANPELEMSDFRLKKPEGYEEKEFEDRGDAPSLLSVGKNAPDFELKDPDGKKVTLSSLHGNVVVLDFWATWCGPCRMAMPTLQKIHEQYKDKPVKVIGINCSEKNGNPAGMMKSKKCTYGLLLGGDKVADLYKVRGLPTLYVIGPEGKVIYAGTGFEPDMEKELKKVIDKSVKEPEI